MLIGKQEVILIILYKIILLIYIGGELLTGNDKSINQISSPLLMDGWMDGEQTLFNSIINKITLLQMIYRLKLILELQWVIIGERRGR
jgi:hypothetical protein